MFYAYKKERHMQAYNLFVSNAAKVYLYWTNNATKAVVFVFDCWADASSAFAAACDISRLQERRSVGNVCVATES